MSEQPSATQTLAAAQEDGPDDSEPSPERKADLTAACEANVAAGKPPYAGVAITTLGEVRWILRERGWAEQPASPRESANLSHADMESADLRTLELTYANLRNANFLEADLRGARMNRVDLRNAEMSNADLSGAYLQAAEMSAVTLYRATLHKTNLSFANLQAADLYGADLSEADLEAANLSSADLGEANLRGADLSLARMGPTTALTNATFDEKTRLVDAGWNGALLGRITWSQVGRLGDEQDIADASTRKERVAALRDAARAYRGLSIALRQQGLLMRASDYRRREQKLERKASFWEGRLASWSFSWLMNLVAGYGERPGRSLIAYLLSIVGFATAYYFLGQTVGPQLTPLGAFVFSMTSFHGRGFFPGGISLDDPLTVLAAFEAFVGLIIEITFIATFTQRFFAR